MGDDTVFSICGNSSDNDDKKKESFERKKKIEEQARWEFFFERGSWVSKVGPWVKKNSLAGCAKKQSVTQHLTAPGLVIGWAQVHLKRNWCSHGAGSLRPNLCLVWRVDCALFTFQLDSGHPTFNASFFLCFFFFSGFRVRGLEAKCSQVSDMLPNEFAIALCVFRVTLCVSAID